MAVKIMVLYKITLSQTAFFGWSLLNDSFQSQTLVGIVRIIVYHAFLVLI